VSLACIQDFQSLCPSQSGIGIGAVQRALDAASTAAERYCGRSFALAENTEYYDGNGYPELPLKRFPLSTTVPPVVYLDINGGYGQTSGAFPSTTLLTLGVNYLYVADRGVLQTRTLPAWWPLGSIGSSASPWGWAGLTRRGTAYIGWPRWPGCIKATYTAGYATIPADIVSAVCAMADYILLATDNGGLITTTGSYIDVSVGSGFITEQLARGNVPALGSARGILDSYRDWKTARGVF
jgi:hypothetical protein